MPKRFRLPSQRDIICAIVSARLVFATFSRTRADKQFNVRGPCHRMNSRGQIGIVPATEEGACFRFRVTCDELATEFSRLTFHGMRVGEGAGG